MDARTLVVLSVVVYAAPALLYVLVGGRLRAILLHAHVGCLLVAGILLNRLYLLPLGSDADAPTLTAGQVAYGGFLLTALLTAMVGRGRHVVRHLLTVVAVASVLGHATARVAAEALEAGYGTTPRLTTLVAPDLLTALSRTLVVLLVLVVLLGLVEVAKARLVGAAMVPVYAISYVAAVLLAGALATVVVVRPETGLGDAVVRSVEAHAALAAAYSVPLLVFVLAFRPTVRDFEQHPLHLRRLVPLPRRELLARVRVQEAELDDQRRRLDATTAEQARSLATTRRILDAATDTFLVALDPDLRITHVNAGAARLLRRDPDGLLGTPAAALHAEWEVERQASALGCAPSYADVLGAQVAAREARDWELLTPGGERLALSLSITAITADGEPVGFVLAGADVTARRAAEAADHAALDRLRDADRVKRQLVSTVSHELRTPISSILGYTELLVDGGFGDLSPAQADAVARVRRNSQRLARIVADLLTLDRPGVRDLETLDLAELVASSDDVLVDLVDGRDVRLDVSLPGEPALVRGDPAALHRLLVNLVGNAVKFVLDPGEVVVEVALEPDRVRLSVADTGIGISDADRERVFERFYRAEEAGARAIPGSGLGLAIVREVVDAHGGRVEIESTRGEGTTVIVRLPRAQDQDSSSPG